MIMHVKVGVFKAPTHIEILQSKQMNFHNSIVKSSNILLVLVLISIKNKVWAIFVG